ncbi:tyrosine-type recombinase/integrase [soil metagenome]
MNRHSSMASKVKAYLAYRRGLGYELKIEGQMLGQFAAFADRRQHRGPHTTELALRWARATPSADRLYWARRLEVVRCLARHLAPTEPGTEIPLRGLLGPAHRRTAPHIYSDVEIAGLMTSACKLGPTGGLRPQTYRTLIGLLAATGLRNSEALHLARHDAELDRGLLTIRMTKFRKTRLVPLHATTTAALRTYSEFRDRSWPNARSDRFFVNDHGLPLPYSTVHTVFRKLCNDLCIASNPRRPRMHDLRHTFACRRVEAWSDAGVDVTHSLAALSTYLGHVKVTDTYWYITATPDLMARAAAKFEQYDSPSGREDSL